MRNKKLIVLLLAAVLLVASVGLMFTPAAARYRAELLGDLIFQAKPLEKLSFSASDWVVTEAGCTLTFSMTQDVEKCRVYLAISEGVVAAESLQVLLTVPGETPMVLEGTCEPIPEVSDLAKRFGQGHVYYFYVEPEVPEGTDETEATQATEDPEEPEEWVFSPKADETFTLTVTGLDSAAQATTLMRLFVEKVD